MFGEPPQSAARVEIGRLGLNPRRKFYYLFDYGDEWWHEITVEKTDGVPEEGTYPRIVEKHGESPPQYPGLDEDEGDEDEGDSEESKFAESP